MHPIYLIRLILATIALLLIAPTAAQAFECQVQEPISAASLNNGGSWTYSVTGGTPNVEYSAKVNWPGDPSNGGHPNDSIVTDEFGNGSNTHPGVWRAADGFLPVVDAYATPLVFREGAFSIHVYPGQIGRATGAKGTTNCDGVVTA